MIKKTIQVTTADGTMPAYVFHPEANTSHPVVIFYFDIFGIRNEFKNMCHRFCKAGYYTILPSLFYRHNNPEHSPMDYINTPNPPLKSDDPHHPMMLNQNTTNAMVIADTGALLQHLHNDPLAQTTHVGTIGTCMGARHALLAAAHYPNQIRSFSAIHGGKLLTTAPDSPHLSIPKLKAEGYFGWASDDHLTNPTHLETYKKDLTHHNVPHTIDLMPQAKHGYFFPERPTHYHASSAEKSWQATLALFKRTLSA